MGSEMCIRDRIDPIGSPHPRIQCSGPLRKDPHPEPASGRALTPSRTRFSSPLAIAREQDGLVPTTFPEGPRRNATATCARAMGQDFRSLAPVRGLTRPPIPHPFHGLEQNCPKTFLHEDIDFFLFSKEKRFFPGLGKKIPRRNKNKNSLGPGPRVTVSWCPPCPGTRVPI